MPEQLHYRLRWQASSIHPGAHPGQMLGAGQLIKRLEPFIANPDPRRIDIRATVLDPFQNYRVRVYQQQSSISVYLIADLSASMAYANKKQAVIDLLLTLVQSAFSYGDKFGFIGCTDSLENRWILPASRLPDAAYRLAENLETYRFSGQASAMLHNSIYLTSTRSLVFFLTDCHFPLSQLAAVLGSLQGHDVVPLILWDKNETVNLPEWGLVCYRDMENDSTKTLLMRPKLKNKIIAAYLRREQELKNCFRFFGTEPLFIRDDLKIDTINCFLLQRAV